MLHQESVGTETVTEAAGWHVDLVRGLLVGVLTVFVGVVARAPDVMAMDLGVERDLAAGRTGVLTSVAAGLTMAAQPAVGVSVAVFAGVVLTLRRRLWMAARVVALFGFALAGTAVVKVVIAEPRPPAVLAAVAADTGQSFPSGHATVAAAMCMAVWMLLRRRRVATRLLLGGAAVAFAVAVGWSRLYLGVHFLPDVVGSYLMVGSSALLVNSVLALPAVRALLPRPV